MTCLIVEDQPPAQRILKRYIADTGHLDLRGTYADALSAGDHLRREAVDLVFLDINLPKLSGVDFIRSLVRPPAIILTTAYADYALEGYELDVVDYLLKPFSFQRFLKAVHKVNLPTPLADTSPVTAATPAEAESNFTFIKSGHEYLRVDLRDLRYLQAGSDYTELVGRDRKYLSTDTLRSWLERLPEGDFVRVHKSFAVNLRWVERVIGNEIFLADRGTVPIGRTYRDNFLQRLGG